MSWLTKIYPNEPAPTMRLRGTTKSVLGFIFMLATTEPMEEDWWQVKIMILNYRN